MFIAVYATVVKLWGNWGIGLTLNDYIERILESVTHAVTVLDLNGRFVFANTTAENVLGVKREAIIGRMFNDRTWGITTPGGRALPDENLPFAKVMKTGRPVYGVEFAIKRPDGTHVLLSVNAGLLRDDRKKPIGVVASFSNITGRKMVEKLLKENERRISTLLENAQLAAVILDEQGDVSFINDFLLNLTGWKWEEAIRQNWFDMFVPLEIRLEVTGMFFKAISKGTIPAHLDHEILTRDGGAGSYPLTTWCFTTRTAISSVRPVSAMISPSGGARNGSFRSGRISSSTQRSAWSSVMLKAHCSAW